MNVLVALLLSIVSLALAITAHVRLGNMEHRLEMETIERNKRNGSQPKSTS